MHQTSSAQVMMHPLRQISSTLGLKSTPTKLLGCTFLI